MKGQRANFFKTPYALTHLRNPYQIREICDPTGEQENW